MKELWSTLEDRVLRYDGISIVNPDTLSDLFYLGVQPSVLRVTEETQDVKSFNEKVGLEQQLKIFDLEEITLPFDWKLPEEYKALDVQEHVLKRFEALLPTLAYSHTQVEAAVSRVETELREFSRKGLNDVLKAIIYVMDVFKSTDQVYGVGRGSSCASFVLFILGVHCVDPILYDIDLEEFIRED